MKPSTAEMKICPLNGGCCLVESCMFWLSNRRDGSGYCLGRKLLEKFIYDADEFDLDE